MGIRIAPRAADLASDLAGRFVVLVTGASDTGAALAGLDAARTALLDLGTTRKGPSTLSPVVLSPKGPLLRVAGLDLGDDALQSVPGVVADALSEAGVVTATVEVLEPKGPLDRLDQTADAAVLRVFPHPTGVDGVLPPRWLDVAAEWALGDSAPREKVALRLLGAPFTVTASDAAATLHAAAKAHAWCDLVHGDLAQRVRSASITFGHAPHLALAAGGPGCDVHALLARFDLLCELAHDLGDGVAYACVDLEATFGAVGAGLALDGWRANGGASPNAVAGQVGDIAVPDAYPYQVLGPGHEARRASLGLPPLGEPLDDGRFEVVLGDPMDWLPRYETRAEALEQGWKELAGLLLTDAELVKLTRGRARATPESEPADEPAGHAPGAGPDLDDIVLEAVPHPRRGLRVTLLELASWIGQEAHSDAPYGVSPVLAAYARWLASGLDNEPRQALKPYAERLTGTRAAGLASAPWRPLPAAEETRAWLAVDWLARVQAPAWLRAVGLDDIAARITKVRPRADRGHLDRLVPLLGTALDRLSGDGASEDDDAAVWEAWERASEASGWVAASEAAWIGVPDGLASSAELRVVELARDPRAHRASKDKGRTVADSTRAAALAAAAEAAWLAVGRSAATAADAIARDGVAEVTLATAWERAAQGATTRLGLHRDEVDQALERTDRAARDTIARLVDDADPSRPAGLALDLAREGAAESDGGAVWTVVQDLARGVVGDHAWYAGLAAAGIASDRVLRTAPGLVDRAVIVAVAREVAGAAARAVAHRDGPDALEPVTAELQVEAIALLDDLLTAG